jgi:hypothetical protein
MSEPAAAEYFVLIEYGIPVGVARPDRAAAVIAWQQAQPNRQFVKVPEQR